MVFAPRRLNQYLPDSTLCKPTGSGSKYSEHVILVIDLFQELALKFLFRVHLKVFMGVFIPHTLAILLRLVNLFKNRFQWP